MTHQLLRQEPTVALKDFEAVVGRFQVPITSFFLRTMRNRDLADDLAQDTFLKVYKAFLKGTEVREEALTGWLFRIANHTLIDEIRRRKRKPCLPLSLFDEDYGIGAGVPSSGDLVNQDGIHFVQERVPAFSSYTGGRFEEQVADRELLTRIFQQLPYKYAICLWWYEREGLSLPEIAERLDITVSAVKMRLVRARVRARAIYYREIHKTRNATNVEHTPRS